MPIWHLSLFLTHTPHTHTHTQAQQREEISFDGGIVAGPNGHHGTMCTCSFVGIEKDLWDALVATAQGGNLSTACVFLTAAQQGGHTPNPEDAQGRCFCHALYGEEKAWGCRPVFDEKDSDSDDDSDLDADDKPKASGAPEEAATESQEAPEEAAPAAATPKKPAARRASKRGRH